MSVFLFSGAETKHFSSREARKSLFKNLSPPAHTQSMYPTSPMPIKKDSSKIASYSTSPLSAAPYPYFGDIDMDSLVTSFNAKSTHQSSFDIHCYDEEEEDQITFPSYDDDWFDAVAKDLELSARNRADSWSTSGSTYSIPSSPESESPELASSISTTPSRSESPELVENCWLQYDHKDDNSIRDEPDRCVDYLSHEWTEADLWTSWKYTRSNSGAFQNGHRLENAIWRSWTKSANSLKAISPSTVNWRKDADNTWLYGPFQKGSQSAAELLNPAPIPKRELTIKRKPINNPYLRPMAKSISENTIQPILKTNLKQRAMSDVMQERSLYTVSLLQQAAPNAHEKFERRRHQGHLSAPVGIAASTKKQVKFDTMVDCIPQEIRREREKSKPRKSQSVPRFPPPPTSAPPPATKSKKSSRRSKSTSDIKQSKSFSDLKKSKTSPNMGKNTLLSTISEEDTDKTGNEKTHWSLRPLPPPPARKNNRDMPFRPTSLDTTTEGPSCKDLLTATLGRPDSFILTQDHKQRPRGAPSPIAEPVYNWKISSISAGTLRHCEDEYDIMARTMFGPYNDRVDMEMDKAMLGAF